MVGFTCESHEHPLSATLQLFCALATREVAMNELLKETSLSKAAFYHDYLAGIKQRIDRHLVIAEGTLQVNFQTQTDK
jgi:hypothetical protein